MGRKGLRAMGKGFTSHSERISKYSLFAPRPGLEDKPENYFIMTYSLTNKNGETVLKIIKEDSRENVIEEEAESEENPVLKSLKEVAERS